MTRDERAAARKRCEAASKAPWVQHDLWLAWLRWLYTQAKRRYTRDAARIDADFDFIVAARTDLPAALDALDAADERIAELEAALKRIQEWDCLNPPNPELCHDHPWLRRLVDAALEKSP